MGEFFLNPAAAGNVTLKSASKRTAISPPPIRQCWQVHAADQIYLTEGTNELVFDYLPNAEQAFISSNWRAATKEPIWLVFQQSRPLFHKASLGL
ncbi:MAG: hypothetical protein IPN76_30975 [Saprospiraceae bacterium]|nr:hypothetical protein [Saprospiraceae bacterium]